MISTSSKKHKPTRQNIRVVLRPAWAAEEALVRGAERLIIPTTIAPIAATKVRAITYAKGWLNMPATLRVLGGGVK